MDMIPCVIFRDTYSGLVHMYSWPNDFCAALAQCDSNDGIVLLVPEDELERVDEDRAALLALKDTGVARTMDTYLEWFYRAPPNEYVSDAAFAEHVAWLNRALLVRNDHARDHAHEQEL